MSIEQNRGDKELRMANIHEHTQDLIQKDLLLDTSGEKCHYILGNGFCGMSMDSGMKYCIKHTDVCGVEE